MLRSLVGSEMCIRDSIRVDGSSRLEIEGNAASSVGNDHDILSPCIGHALGALKSRLTPQLGSRKNMMLAPNWIHGCPARSPQPPLNEVVTFECHGRAHFPRLLRCLLFRLFRLFRSLMQRATMLSTRGRLHVCTIGIVGVLLTPYAVGRCKYSSDRRWY